ncbi:MAG: hypothetical protein ACTSSG_06555 [Candidatus Heimdallarchaeaceae archaeon]
MNIENEDEEYVKERIERVKKLLLKLYGLNLEVLPKDLLKYFSFESPTGDTISLQNVLDNDLLLIHELVEIHELKRRNLPLSIELFSEYADELFEAHIYATKIELLIAGKLRNFEWIKKRMKMITTWLEEDRMPEHLEQECRRILQEYSSLLDNQVLSSEK